MIPKFIGTCGRVFNVDEIACVLTKTYGAAYTLCFSHVNPRTYCLQSHNLDGAEYKLLAKALVGKEGFIDVRGDLYNPKAILSVVPRMNKTVKEYEVYFVEGARLMVDDANGRELIRQLTTLQEERN